MFSAYEIFIIPRVACVPFCKFPEIVLLPSKSKLLNIIKQSQKLLENHIFEPFLSEMGSNKSSLKTFASGYG